VELLAEDLALLAGLVPVALVEVAAVVLVHVVAAREALEAPLVRASERALPRVDAQVAVKVLDAVERELAVRARAGLHGRRGRIFLRQLLLLLLLLLLCLHDWSGGSSSSVG